MEQQIQPVQLGVAIDGRLYRQLRIRAAIENTTMRAILERALKEHLVDDAAQAPTSLAAGAPS